MKALNKRKVGGGKACTPAGFMVWQFSFTGKVLVGFALTVSGTVVLKDKPSNQYELG